MANCCGGASAVIIKGGDGLAVTGSGTVTDPYVISGDVEAVMRGAETETVTVSVTGSGTSTDPYLITANASITVNDLEDVSDPVPPVLGDVLQYDGTQWVYGPAPTQEPGAVNTGSGITGDGTVGDPIGIAVSNIVDTSTAGLYTYIDSNGELRAQAVSSVAWANVSGKPSSFTPAAHTHPNSDLTGMLKGTAAPTAGLGSDDNFYFQYS